MPDIFAVSDWHLGHDKEFIWKARGFDSLVEMEDEIVRRHNERVKPQDIVYVLGDLMLGPLADRNIELIKSMNGNKIIIAGNHDTKSRRMLYEAIGWPVYDALAIKAYGYNFYLSHYPTITSNLEKESLKQCVINLHGHTHSTSRFYYDVPYLYNVGMDSHSCCPVSLMEAIEEIKDKIHECKEYL